MGGGAKVDAGKRLTVLWLAGCLLLVLACNHSTLSRSNPSTSITRLPALTQQTRLTAAPTIHPAASVAPQVASASDEIRYSDWLLGSDSACCSGVIEWDDFHENSQGYNKTYADIAACSFPLFMDLEHGSIEGKTSGEGSFSEFNSARAQAQFSAHVVESWVKPLPTLDGWHFGGVLEVYILMDAARKGWTGDEPTWLEGTRTITVQTNFIGQTDQNGAPGGGYTWSTQPEAPVSFQMTCQACPLPGGFPPPPLPR